MSLTYNQAVEQTITAGEQIHQIVNGTATTEVTVEDGSKVPSVRKALLDNFYFKDPIAWQVGQTENVFNQLRKFTDGSWWYAPSATASNPISMGSTPVGDSLWKIYDFDAIGKLTPQLREALRRSYADAGYTLVGGSFESGGTLNNTNDVLLHKASGIAYSWGGALPKVVSAGSTPATSGGVGAGAWVDRTDVTLRSEINIINKRFACVADMVSDYALIAGGIVETIGYYSGWAATVVKPKGGNRYEIVPAGTGTEDGGSFITLSNGLQAKSVFSSVIDVYKYGAYGDNVHNDTSAIQKALATGLNVYIPDSAEGYYVDGELNLSQGQEIYGDGEWGPSTIYYHGSGTCIKISAYNSASRNCTVRKLQINNVGTGVNGIHIYGRGAADINDWHKIHDVRISGFATQIRITGRTIWSSFINVDLQNGVNGLIAEYGSAGTMSFNANHFINLRCANMSLEGMKVYKGQACTWETCNFESCNTSNTAATAAVYIENSESFIFNNCYLEYNGFGCTNTKNSPTTCSYGIQFSGTYNYSPKIIGGYNVTTGIPIYINSINIMGGSVSGGRYNTLSGDAFYIKPGNTGSPYTAGSHPFVIESDCRFDSADSDYIMLPLDSNSNRRCSVEQGSSTYWVTSDTQTGFDWYRTRHLTFNNIGAPAQITAFYNQYPGQELTIYNFSSSDTISIAGALTKSGSAITIPVSTVATLKVLGYPYDRKVYLANSMTL